MLGADIFTARFARTRSIGPPADEMRPSGVYNLLFISCNKPFSRRVDTVCNSAAATVSQPISVMSVIIFSMRQNVKTTAVYYYHCYYIIIRARAPGSFFVFFFYTKSCNETCPMHKAGGGATANVQYYV